MPYNDAIFVKQPGLGGSVAWHQDGVTHWDSPEWDEGIHGFNFQVQLYRTTPANALWVVPGTHKTGRVDIEAKVAANGGLDTLPDAVPLLCEPGDVTVVNRQCLHGFVCECVGRSSGVDDVRVPPAPVGARGGGQADVEGRRSRLEGRPDLRRATDLRALSGHRGWRSTPAGSTSPTRPPFRYEPFAGLEDDFRWTTTPSSG